MQNESRRNFQREHFHPLGPLAGSATRREIGRDAACSAPFFGCFKTGVTPGRPADSSKAFGGASGREIEGHDILCPGSEPSTAEGALLTMVVFAYNGCETRLKIETVVPDSDAMPLVQAIPSASRGLDSQDYKVAISHVETVQWLAPTKLESQPGSVTPQL
jgi:hypothetical protein